MTDQYEDHELVITTFNRPRYLFRLLAYIASDLPIGRVRIVDASTEPHRSENTRVIAAFADRMPILHDLLAPGMEMIEHARYAYGSAATPFMTLCHDDNFCVPAAVREQVAFLRAHPDYVNCCGLVAGLGDDKGRVTAYVSDSVALEQDDPLERVAHFLANHWSADFGTWRSEARRDAACLLDLYELDEGIGEPLTCGVSALAGKFHQIQAISVLFCVHGSNRGSGAAERKSNLIKPDFMAILDRTGALFAGFCERYGVPPPADPRAWYLTAYLRYVGKWWHLYHIMARGLRREAEASLGREEIAAMDARAKVAVFDDLLRLGEEHVADIRAAMGQVEKQTHPSQGELFVIVDGNVILADIPTCHDDPLTVLALPQSSVLPDAYAALRDRLLQPGWHADYSVFRERALERVLGRQAQRADAAALFDSACLAALVAILRPLGGAHPFRIGHIAASAGVDADDSSAREALLAAACHLQAHAAPHLGANDPVVMARERCRGSGFRILHGRPVPGARTLPFIMGQVRNAQGVTFIPLDFSNGPGAYLARGHQVWLCVDVAEVRGKMQFSLYSRGTLDMLVPISEQSGPRELYFPLRSLDAQYLVLRDITHGGAVGRCQIAGLRWMAAPTPARVAGANAATPDVAAVA